VITAASKLDIPEEQKANLYKCMNPFTMHGNDQVVKLGSWRPSLCTGSFWSGFEPCTDLETNCLRSQKFWQPFKQHEELFDFTKYLGLFVCGILPPSAVSKLAEKDFANVNFIMSSMTGSLKKPWVFQGC